MLHELNTEYLTHCLMRIAAVLIGCMPSVLVYAVTMSIWCKWYWWWIKAAAVLALWHCDVGDKRVRQKLWFHWQMPHLWLPWTEHQEWPTDSRRTFRQSAISLSHSPATWWRRYTFSDNSNQHWHQQQQN